ncbi:MAG: ABC transporter ATP-binding protein [Bacteroidales bacterium]|nr:ABC transporter ATP-binding protein [Bacteroidales bacterium]
MITIKNLTFGYSKQKMLFKDLDLGLQEGHIYGLLGKNGTGKTTLLKIITGLCFPQGGEVSTMDYPAPLRQAGMLENLFFLTEEIFTPYLKIKDYVKANAPFYKHFNLEQFNEYLSLFDMDNQNDYLTKMSLGQKKKVMICFALACNTPVLIMDEPTNGLDIPSKSTFRKILAMAADEGKTIVISTHQVRDLHSLIDAVIILEQGKILLNADIDTIARQLLFKVNEDNNIDEADILYKEESLKGDVVVAINKEHQESKVDIELLFNAVMNHPQKINEIFHA